MASERKFVIENIRRVLLREYLMKETQRAGFGGLDIQRTPMGTRISLFIERPGIVIGRQGGAIKTLTETLEKKFKFDNPQIEVQEVENPSLNAQIMAEKLSVALERGWHFRRAGHSTVRRIMDAGARGCQVVISGKLTGQRHRTEKFKEGHIKHCGDPKSRFMREGFAVATLKLGIIGVKVQIMDSMARLPDDIEVEKAVAKAVEEAAAEAETVPAAEPEVEGAEGAEEPIEAEQEAEAAAEAQAAGSAEPAAVATQEIAKPVAAPKPKPEPVSEAKEAPKPKGEKPEPKKKPVKKAADLKTKKLRKVAKKLEDLGEDVDVDLREEGDEK